MFSKTSRIILFGSIDISLTISRSISLSSGVGNEPDLGLRQGRG